MRNNPEGISRIIRQIQRPPMHYVGLEIPDEFYDEVPPFELDLDRVEPDIAGRDIGIWPVERAKPLRKTWYGQEL